MQCHAPGERSATKIAGEIGRDLCPGEACMRELYAKDRAVAAAMKRRLSGKVSCVDYPAFASIQAECDTFFRDLIREGLVSRVHNVLQHIPAWRYTQSPIGGESEETATRERAFG